ncbi:MAG: hypothetical protein LLG24_03450 [Actinomycetia bacterium]|nr:hypothetical protein [Actinomycetes bacterium]
MPVYEYRCPACSEHFEVTRNIADTSSQACPVCGASAKRVFSPVGIVFKGSGFHNTDYRRSPASETQAASTSSDASCGGETSSACENCPAAD